MINEGTQEQMVMSELSFSLVYKFGIAIDYLLFSEERETSPHWVKSRANFYLVQW